MRNHYLANAALAMACAVAITLVAGRSAASAQSLPVARAEPGGEVPAQAPPSAASGWTVEVARPRLAATRIKLSATPVRTRLLVDLTAPVAVRATTLADPDRVVVDLPEVEFKVDPALGQRGEGLVKAFRYGLFGPKPAAALSS